MVYFKVEYNLGINKRNWVVKDGKNIFSLNCSNAWFIKTLDFDKRKFITTYSESTFVRLLEYFTIIAFEVLDFAFRPYNAHVFERNVKSTTSKNST